MSCRAGLTEDSLVFLHFAIPCSLYKQGGGTPCQALTSSGHPPQKMKSPDQFVRTMAAPCHDPQPLTKSIVSEDLLPRRLPAGQRGTWALPSIPSTPPPPHLVTLFSSLSHPPAPHPWPLPSSHSWWPVMLPSWFRRVFSSVSPLLRAHIPRLTLRRIPTSFCWW